MNAKIQIRKKGKVRVLDAVVLDMRQNMAYVVYEGDHAAWVFRREIISIS